ncbi:MAG: glycosyltransferase, partial [Pleurocapsa sp.]
MSFCKNQILQDPNNIELYHQAISLDKKDVELYLGLGRTLVKQGKIDEAISINQIGLQIQPKNQELLEGFNQLREQKIAPSSNITAKINNIVSSALSNQETSRKEDFLQLPCHPSPVVSIIIPVYNQIDYTSKCLRSIAEQIPAALEIEVIVVNDCSTDNTAAILDQVRGLKRIDSQENLGFLHSCNRGVQAASGEYIYFLNNDTELRPQALEHLLSVFEQDSEVGAVGSKLIYPDGSLQEAGGIVFQNASAWNFGTKENVAAPQYNYLRPVDYCSGASLLVKRTVFAALTGFDTNFSPAYYEDTDLCFAIRHQLGLKIMYQPKSEVIHHEGISCGTRLDSPVKRYQSINQAKFAQKWAAELVGYSGDSSKAGIAAASRRHLCSNTILVVDLYAPCYDKESGARRIWEILQIFKQLNNHVIFLADNGVKERPYVEMLQERSIEVVYQESGYELAVEQQLEELLSFVDMAWVCRP